MAIVKNALLEVFFTEKVAKVKKKLCRGEKSLCFCGAHSFVWGVIRISMRI